MSSPAHYYLTLTEAAAIAYPKGWRRPPVDEIDQQRAAEAREDGRREAAEYTATGHTDNDWGSL